MNDDRISIPENDVETEENTTHIKIAVIETQDVGHVEFNDGDGVAQIPRR